MERENQKMYELAYFIAPLQKEKTVFTATDKIKNSVNRIGEIHKEEPVRKRQLAYPIRHNRYGYFGMMQFYAEPKKINEINKELFLDKDLLKHLIIEVDKKQLAQAQKTPISVSVQEKMKKLMDESKIEESIFKTESAAAQKEEQKIGLEDLDKKLEEILNK